MYSRNSKFLAQVNPQSTNAIGFRIERIREIYYTREKSVRYHRKPLRLSSFDRAYVVTSNSNQIT